MGFHSRVTLAYGFAPTFLRKTQKSEIMSKFNILFETISSKEALKFKNMVIFGILVQFPIARKNREGGSMSLDPPDQEAPRKTSQL